MRLLTKLTLFIALSKLVIVVLFVILLPVLVNNIAFRFTNYSLGEQQQKVMQIIQKNGIDYYLEGEQSYGSYTMLKEEYISLVHSENVPLFDTIETSRRLVENDTLTYRVLIHVFDYGNKRYTLEIGKTTASINAYNRLLQQFALYVLVGLIAIAILVDLLYTRYLIRPLGVIIRTKLLHRKFPFREHLVHIKTSTSDFNYLDQSLIDLMSNVRQAFEKEREFTSNASHELMTPISILQNKMENLMVSGGIDEAVQEKILGMMKTLNRLKKIVHSLLFISRIENDQFAKKDELNIAGLIDEMKDELEHRMEVKNIRFTMQVSGTLMLQKLNHDLLFQLLYNIINNAIRYNREGGEIIVSDHLVPGKSYTVLVKDSGIGIPPAELDTIFDRFRKSAHGDEEGYGLGLYIVRTIAQYLGLEIRVESEVNKGTTFRILFSHEHIR